MRGCSVHEGGRADLQFSIRDLLLEHGVELPRSVVDLPANTARTHPSVKAGPCGQRSVTVILACMLVTSRCHSNHL